MDKHTIQINGDLYEKLFNYCKLNKLKVSQYCNELLERLFNMDIYGDIPFGKIISSDEKQAETVCEIENKVIIEEKLQEKAQENVQEIVTENHAENNKSVNKSNKRRL